MIEFSSACVTVPSRFTVESVTLIFPVLDQLPPWPMLNVLALTTLTVPLLLKLLALIVERVAVVDVDHALVDEGSAIDGEVAATKNGPDGALVDQAVAGLA